ncbi:hypothetical protein RMCBS344292_12053 [Rhizopus microsporus]|nr:hypothetical protein RMCBS344292_12053 [Rhizopus microsporus]
MKPQDKASSSYVHRKLQELPFVKKLNTNKYRSLKENTLTAISSNKTLEITSKLKNIDKKEIDSVQTFIKTVDVEVCRQTVISSLKRMEYGSYFSAHKPVLTEEHMKKKLRWAHEHVNWTVEQWSSVI